jgi:glyoxylase-like metal-dependent hydrolase (beta-lactamase superfamily II)
MLKIWTRAVGDYQVNTILVWCDKTKCAVLFDPSAEAETIIDEIERNELKLIAVVNTHGHLDHIADNGLFTAQYGVPLYIHALDRPMLTNPALNLSLMTGDPIVSPDADFELKDGDALPVGEESLKALYVPGHTQGSLDFYSPGILISGDTLFAGSVGRSDLPGGNGEQLLTAIRTKLYSLPEETVVYPGHGPTTTIGEERRTNPYIRA